MLCLVCRLWVHALAEFNKYVSLMLSLLPRRGGASRLVLSQVLCPVWALRVFVVMIALICTKSFQPLTLYFVQRFVQIL